jgi:asparagine synthase (glutamine-hydrolysing)
MCGVSGFFGVSKYFESAPEEICRRMLETIVHRGPDDGGCWVDKDAGVALGHRRLSILDLSSAGHQPMSSADGRYVLIFNGEIYNHLKLRHDLDGVSHHDWRGHSDTETLLAGFEVWGIQGTLERTIGMFAMAIWDRQSSTLTLTRDRVGEKPMYYGWQGHGQDAAFLFGSELKALRAHPAFSARIHRGALSLFLRHNCIPAPYSIHEGIFKLMPGHLLTVSMARPEPELRAYWSGAQIVAKGVSNVFKGTATQAIDDLEFLLTDAVRIQMMADVPVGAFLSGGVDSSLIVALMQTQSNRPVKTFSIGFNEAGYNEAVYAKAVAKHLGTDHEELYASSRQALDLIERLPTLYDEPFSDSSQLPTFLVSQLARQHVMVSLSGDAGDELFCGYNRYRVAAGSWRKLSLLPMSARKILARGINGISPSRWNRMASMWPAGGLPDNLGDRLHKGAQVLSSGSLDEFYRRLVSHWDDPASVVIDGDEPPTLLTEHALDSSGLSPVQKMMALDMLTYLPDDILTKIDRAAMGLGLETRIPFLDHRVVEFAWSLPQDLKLRDGQTKWILRQALYRYIPMALIERPKMGFGVPLGEWLRGPLREWAESLINVARLQREGYFHAQPIWAKWLEHLSGRHNWAHHLWDILMFQLWLQEQKNDDAAFL